MLKIAKTCLLVAVVALAGCQSAIRPSPAHIERSRAFAASVDDVWEAAVSTFAESGVPIATLEKDSGIIVLQGATYWHSDANEGQLSWLEKIIGREANGNMVMRDSGAGTTTATVNISMRAHVQHGTGGSTFPFQYYWIETYSNGRIEGRLLDGISQKLAQHRQ